MDTEELQREKHLRDTKKAKQYIFAQSTSDHEICGIRKWPLGTTAQENGNQS